MLSAAEAARRLLSLNQKGIVGMDDPTEAGLAYRWWVRDGILYGAWWRGGVTLYGDVSDIAQGIA